MIVRLSLRVSNITVLARGAQCSLHRPESAQEQGVFPELINQCVYGRARLPQHRQVLLPRAIRIYIKNQVPGTYPENDLRRGAAEPHPIIVK